MGRRILYRRTADVEPDGASTLLPGHGRPHFRGEYGCDELTHGAPDLYD
jgi:hypothetical protein